MENGIHCTGIFTYLLNKPFRSVIEGWRGGKKKVKFAQSKLLQLWLFSIKPCSKSKANHCLSITNQASSDKRQLFRPFTAKYWRCSSQKVSPEMRKTSGYTLIPRKAQHSSAAGWRGLIVNKGSQISSMIPFSAAEGKRNPFLFTQVAQQHIPKARKTQLPWTKSP